MANRAFAFTDKTRKAAFARQQMVCACCGDYLGNLYDNAHHVVPNQVGRANDAGHAWLREVDNCVILCDSCHFRVHQDGKYENGAVPPPDYYPFSHGKQSGEHLEWVAQTQERFWSA